MANIAKIVDELSTLTVLEIAELKKLLEEKWGVTAAAPVAAAPAAGPAAPAAAEKSEFDVILVSHGEKKIDVIKVIREVAGLGLAEAKTAAETANFKLKEGLSKSEAEEIKKKLEAAGAKVELK